MNITRLEKGHKKQLLEFITSAYGAYPLAMWFESKPTTDELNDLFEKKMKNIDNLNSIDIVQIEGKKIIGECEIVKVAADIGAIGIIIRKGHTGKGHGTELLEKGLGAAKELGIRRIRAEILDKNERAINFFQRNGFEMKGIEEKSVLRENKKHNVLLLEKMI